MALLQTFLGGPDLRQQPRFLLMSAEAAGLVALFGFMPIGLRWLMTLAAWFMAARFFFEMPWPKTMLLFLVLVVLTYISDLAILGALCL